MISEFSLGTTVPHEEPCIQLGKPNYSAFSKMEANALTEQIVRELGEPPGGCKMKLSTNPHDFGTYYDVVLEYDDSKADNVEWMLKVESSIPYKWDNISLLKLRKSGYRL